MLNGSVFAVQEFLLHCHLVMLRALSQPRSTAMGGAQLLPSGIVKNISLAISDPQIPTAFLSGMHWAALQILQDCGDCGCAGAA